MSCVVPRVYSYPNPRRKSWTHSFHSQVRHDVTVNYSTVLKTPPPLQHAPFLTGWRLVLQRRFIAHPRPTPTSHVPHPYSLQSPPALHLTVHIRVSHQCNARVDDCASRAKSPLGSTSKVAEDFAFGGVDSDDMNVNPLMASWNHVVLWCKAPTPSVSLAFNLRPSVTHAPTPHTPNLLLALSEIDQIAHMRRL